MDSKKIHRANNPVNKTLTLVVIATFLFSTSCRSTRAIKAQPEALQNELRKGDLVKVTTKDGRFFELRIVDISSKAIIGTTAIAKTTSLQQQIRQAHGADNQQIFFNEISKLEKRNIDAGKTIGFGIVLGIVVFMAGALYIPSIRD